jgi:pSer/pThr/pTyr-binding forkhead associated (FHA) protein
MQVVLVMFRADGQRRSFSVARDMTVIGRREDCDLRIPLSDVSRKHCRLIKDGDTLRVEDLGSSNGTFHNGQRVQTAEIGAGDTLQIGPVVFVAQIDGQPADEDLQPVIAATAAGPADDVAVEGLEEIPEELEEAPVELGDDDSVPPSPPAASADGDFDPLEALNANDEGDSEFAFTLDDEATGDDAAGEAAAEGDDAVVNLDDEPADLEESEPDRKA